MKNKIKFLLVCVFCVCCLYLLTNVTYTSFQSGINANVSSTISTWSIKINDQDVTSTLNQTLNISNISWDSTHADTTLVAPGSSGTTQFVIDPTTTKVAIRFDFTYIDKTVDSNNVLTVTNVAISDNSLVKTGANVYTGIFTLDEIQAGNPKTLTVTLEWINNELNNDNDSSIGLGQTSPNFVTFDLEASQYTGETITPFVE